MSNSHKQSKNRKGGYSRSNRRNNNNSKPPYSPNALPKQRNQKFNNTPRPLNYSQLAEIYIKSLQKDIQIYLSNKENKIPNKNLLTQIQRQETELDLLSTHLSPNSKNSYDKIQLALINSGFYMELKKYEEKCEAEGLEKDLITNHYSSSIYSGYLDS